VGFGRKFLQLDNEALNFVILSTSKELEQWRI